MSTKNIRRLAEQTRVAGGWDWDMFLRGTNPDKLFRDAAEQDRHEHGHDGYSGSIGQSYNYKLVTRNPMTRAEANSHAESDQEHMYKGECKAIPVAQEKLLGREKEVTVKVKARNRDDALEAAKAKAKTFVTLRQGARFIVEITQYPQKKRGGGLPTLEKSTPTLKGYVIVQGWGTDLWSKVLTTGRTVVHANKAKANKALREYLAGIDEHNSKHTYTFVRVEGTETVRVSEASSDIPTWEVGIKYRQVKLGKTVGYLFYGVANS